ncbi:MAG: hypothetical protein ACTHZ5_00495 [Micrococcaceae bacterium]
MESRRVTPTAAKSFAQRVRRWVVIMIIASFSIAAIAGIIVLFGDVNSDPAYQVLASTALIGVLSVAVFCGVVLVGKRWQTFGWVTVTVALLTLLWCLRLVWGEPSWDEPTVEVTATACTLTAALSVSSLLLLLAEHRIRAVRIGLFVTLALIGVGVVMILLPVWGLQLDDFDWYIRAAGVIWILAALGIVVLPVLSIALKNTQALPADAAVTRLSPASVHHIETVAQRAGISPDELITRVLPSDTEAPEPH